MINETPVGTSSFTVSVVAFAQSASGNVTPGLTFASSALNSPSSQIAVR